MAIFNNSRIEDKTKSSDANTTIITAGAKIKGDMTLSCNIFIDGEFEGTINSKNDVNVGKNGKVTGEIYANRVVVNGFIKGKVNSSRVEIKALGKVEGEVESAELVIEAKAIFSGNSIVKQKETPKKK